MGNIIFIIGCLIGIIGVVVSWYQIMIKNNKRISFWQTFMWICICTMLILTSVAKAFK